MALQHTGVFEREPVLSISVQWSEPALKWHEKVFFQFCSAKHFRARRGICLGFVNPDPEDNEKSHEHHMLAVQAQTTLDGLKCL